MDGTRAQDDGTNDGSEQAFERGPARPTPAAEARRSGECAVRLPNGLSIARTDAEDVAARSALRVCTIDDVLVELARHGIHSVDLGSSLGNVFRSRQWEATPWRAWSERRDGRRRLVRVWRLAGARSRPWVNDPRAQSAW